MSLEAALDEERRDVLALLEGRSTTSHRAQLANRGRNASPSGMPQSPVRSMLDIGDDFGPASRSTSITSASNRRSASIAGQGAGITTPGSATFPPAIRSMLSPDSPPSLTADARPTPAHLRSASPAFNAPKINVEKEYNFEILPTNEHGTMPKRAAQGVKKPTNAYDNARSEATKAFIERTQQGSKSKSPSRFFGRSKSPAMRTKRLNSNSSNLMNSPNTYMSETGEMIDISNAYRRLSDAAMLRSGSSLSELPVRKGLDPSRGELTAPDGTIRLTEDYAEEDALESSDSASDSSGDDVWDSEKRRGRGRQRKGEDGSVSGASSRSPKSLLAAAEDERQAQVANSKYSSLLDAVPGVDAVDGKLSSSKRHGIHPRTSYDVATPSFVTPHGSDDEEELDDIRRAQRLEMNVSPISSNAQLHRCIRQVVRGEYKELAEEAAQGLRRQRMYLVATDMSEEAAYALEWTIGTVLKDGDTLFAIYAADAEDVKDYGDAKSGPSQNADAVEIGQGAAIMKDTAAMVRLLSNTEDTVTIPAVSSSGHRKGASSLSTSFGDHRNDSPAARSTSRVPLPMQQLRRKDYTGMSNAEKERWKATELVTERCVTLLRKTKLQVRVVVDVFHCKSPKHMITEVIDYLEPTLVILGSRGRSAIKGVLLGSFSNYLVTKSSVPVMVARKKLRKQSKSLRPRLSNVLVTPMNNAKLASAKIDKIISKDKDDS